MKEIRMAGVPEHFNLPWHLAYEEGVFEDLGIDLEFTDYPGGTGAMSQGLLDGEVDLALLLTEGAVKFISENPSYKIIKVYVDSPLLWGVHVPQESVVKDANDLKSLPFAISRYGSGSHLMAYVYAQNKGLFTKDLEFATIKNLDGLRAGYKDGLDGLFLWEKFTTKPYVDNGEMRRVDVCPTPWPCFVMVAHEDFIEENKDEMSNLLDAINMVLDDFKDRPDIVEEIADRYGLESKDVAEWISDTSWDASLQVKSSMLKNVVATLKKLEILKKDVQPSNLVSQLTELV